jgi:hypothetical protein
VKRQKPMADLPIHVALSEHCPADTLYMLSPGDAGTLAEHPQLARLLASGTVVVARSLEQAEEIDEVRSAVGRVVRLAL